VNAFLKRHLRRVMNLWPPFFGAGIKVTRISPDWRQVDVELRPHFWNRNYVGTHYGGSLYSMTDPFYMIMLIESLGSDYVVWDKAGSIRFKRPGKGVVSAQFRITDAQIEDIRTKLQTQERYEPSFSVDVQDRSGAIVCEVEKLIHVRKREPATRK
jgi:hypothetical protein